MNFLELAGGLCRHYGWPPGFYHGMPWRTFRAWLRQARRDRDREVAASQPDPGRWGGAGDGWFAEQRARARAVVV